MQSLNFNNQVWECYKGLEEYDDSNKYSLCVKKKFRLYQVW